jgi:hypothetical protein
MTAIILALLVLVWTDDKPTTQARVAVYWALLAVVTYADGWGVAFPLLSAWCSGIAYSTWAEHR